MQSLFYIFSYYTSNYYFLVYGECVQCICLYWGIWGGILFVITTQGNHVLVLQIKQDARLFER
jgi:hypothetical protein